MLTMKVAVSVEIPERWRTSRWDWCAGGLLLALTLAAIADVGLASSAWGRTPGLLVLGYRAGASAFSRYLNKLYYRLGYEMGAFDHERQLMFDMLSAMHNGDSLYEWLDNHAKCRLIEIMSELAEDAKKRPTRRWGVRRQRAGLGNQWE